MGIGNAGRDFDPEILKKISSETGGKYFSANSIEKLKEIYSVINQLEKSEIKANKYIKKTYYFQYILALALLLMTSYFIVANKE